MSESSLERMDFPNGVSELQDIRRVNSVQGSVLVRLMRNAALLYGFTRCPWLSNGGESGSVVYQKMCIVQGSLKAREESV